MGSILISLLGGGLISWWITRSYYQSSTNALDRQFADQAATLNAPVTIKKFMAMVETGKWKQQYVDDNEIWFCEEDRSYQIHIAEDSTEFHESWMDVFPASHGRMFNVHLKVASTLIDTIPFISTDGGRYRVPLPKRIVIDEKLVYYWRPDRVDYQVANIFGEFYRFDTIEQVAQFTGVEIDNGKMFT